MDFVKLPKLKKGDKVAILSPSFAAPGKWPLVYELGLKRLQEVFGLEPVEFPATKKLGASKEERSKDLIDAFENKEIKAVIASLGGDDQITYIKNLSATPFINNPKPFFGFSDNAHFENFLWLHGIPSYYGGSLFTEFAMQKRMDPNTIEYSIGGVKRAIKVDPELAIALNGLSGSAVADVFKGLQIMASVVRVTATGLNPVFGLVSNPIKDIVTQQMSTAGTIGGVFVKEIVEIRNGG